MTLQPQEGWEKEFQNLIQDSSVMTGQDACREIVSFFRSLLAKRDRKMVKRLEKMKKETKTCKVPKCKMCIDCVAKGYNKALTDAIEAIEEGG